MQHGIYRGSGFSFGLAGAPVQGLYLVGEYGAIDASDLRDYFKGVAFDFGGDWAIDHQPAFLVVDSGADH